MCRCDRGVGVGAGTGVSRAGHGEISMMDSAVVTPADATDQRGQIKLGWVRYSREVE